MRKPAKSAKLAKPLLTDTIITSTDVSVLLGISLVRISEVERAGWMTRVEKGRWRLGDVVHGYIACLRDEKKRSTQTATLSRVQTARAEAIEAKTARENGQTIALADALELVDDVVGTLKGDLDGLPARVTRDMVARRRLEAELNDILGRAADRIEQQAGGAAEANGSRHPAAPALLS